MKLYLTLCGLLLATVAFSQQAAKLLTHRVFVKSNLLSLVAGRPTVSLEKPFTHTFGMELSFVQGRFNSIFWTDHYSYHGFLVRAKRYLTEPDYGHITPYAALYAGTLTRTIQSTGWTDRTGYLGFPSRDFSAHSIRGGGTLGVMWFSRKRMLVEGSTSLGYGRYTKLIRADRHSSAYPDVQLWLSAGYCF